MKKQLDAKFPACIDKHECVIVLASASMITSPTLRSLLSSLRTHKYILKKQSLIFLHVEAFE